jgi:hypothetical protein
MLTSLNYTYTGTNVIKSSGTKCVIVFFYIIKKLKYFDTIFKRPSVNFPANQWDGIGKAQWKDRRTGRPGDYSLFVIAGQSMFIFL